MMNHSQLVAYIVVVAVSVGASLLAARSATNDTQELEERISTKVSIALDKANDQRVAALKKANDQRIAALEVVCIRDSKTTKSSIKVRKNQAKNNRVSGYDETSKDTKSARKALRGQARIEAESARRLEELRCRPKK